MANVSSVAPRESAAAKVSDRFDEETDIVIVGGGAGGLSSALFSRWFGSEVMLLEKAPELGGTARKAAFWYWVPNNEPMRALGIEDRKEDCIRYIARLSRPESYVADHPTFGLSSREYELCEAFYDNASIATELLAKRGALEYRHCTDVPNYWAELPENRTPTGRVLLPKNARESMSDGGAVAVESMVAAGQRDGVQYRTGMRVQRLITDDTGEVVGVEASSASGDRLRVRARKAVIFASGGFTHDPALRKNFLSVPVFGGCAARTNEGDFVRIASGVGASLGNMNYAWMCPIILEKALNDDPNLIGTFSPSGDSMIFVNKQGVRVTNEKLAYNEAAQAFFEWDPAKAEYPNLVLIAIWDKRSQTHSASDEYGRFIVPDGANDGHVVHGRDLDELAANIAARLAQYSDRLSVELADDFRSNLQATIDRFNGFAVSGVDEDFRRGQRVVEQLFNGPVASEPAGPNPTMFPIDGQGPFFATLLTGGNLDTKGGPRTNAHGQVLNDLDEVIPGLYGVGNCVASVSGRSYWAGGATLGPILAYAYLAAKSANEQPSRAFPRHASQFEEHGAPSLNDSENKLSPLVENRGCAAQSAS